MSLLRRSFVACFCGLGILSLSSLAPANPVNEDDLTPGKFVRGDTNNDGREDISDAVFLLNFLFNGGRAPPCKAVADINKDGNRDISDAVFLLRYLFAGSAAPADPFPVCGSDPDGLQCSGSNCNV
jgi:hypothetical protein